MKTQLLEDIGQSATLSLVPTGRAASPARPRSAFGVWRKMPAPQPAPHGPVFDFAPPSPAPAPDLFQREPGWIARSGPRYLLWGTCVLSAALLVQAAWWFYEERKDASALALVADELKAEPQFDKAVKRRALAVKEFTLGPEGDVHVEPAALDLPLVLLEPEPKPKPKPKPAKPDPESPMSAALKACKEHGYSAAQCVKRACSVTKYGFVCRGK